MRRALLTALGASAVLVAPAPASGAEVVVTGLDTLSWDKPVVDIQPGDSVRWTFAGTAQVHNVMSTSPNWQIRTALGAIPAPDTAPLTFTAVGEYTYVCEVHATMTGTIRVADVPPPPPPPPPLSAQPFANDAPAPAPETAVALDKAKPRLSSVSARRSRVRFKVSEESVTTVDFRRGGKRVKRYRVAGVGRLSVTGHLRPGRYTVTLRAVDGAGNTSSMRRVRLIVR